MKKTFLAIGLGLTAVAAAAIAGRAFAGATTKTPVTITTSASGGQASGMLGTARSTSGSGWIGCWANSVQDFMSGGCGASNGTKSVSCKFSFDSFPMYLHQLHAMTSDSYVSFSFDANKICTFLQVNSYSYDEPRRM